MVGLTFGSVAATARSVDGAREVFTWSTPLRHEPCLLGQLRRANHELLMSYSVSLHAARRGSFAAAALAMSRCAQQIHAVQRLEALRLHPPISRCLAGDPDTLTTVSGLRREANALARRFLRLIEGLFGGPRRAMPDAALTIEAEALLKRYLMQKERHLYRFYALVAPAADATAK
jgi:hypothetical protein